MSDLIVSSVSSVIGDIETLAKFLLEFLFDWNMSVAGVRHIHPISLLTLSFYKHHHTLFILNTLVFYSP